MHFSSVAIAIYAFSYIASSNYRFMYSGIIPVFVAFLAASNANINQYISHSHCSELWMVMLQCHDKQLGYLHVYSII